MALNIQPVGELDTLVVLSNLRLRHWARWEGEGDVQTIPIRDEDGELPWIQRGDWKSLQSFLERLRNEAAPFLSGRPAELGRCWIEMLRPGGHSPWLTDPVADWLTLRIALATPANGWLYCGGQGMVIPVGGVCYVNTAAPTSSLNLGSFPRLHLVIEVLKPAVP